MIEKGTIKAQRFLTAIGEKHPEHLEGVSRELWKRIWSRVRGLCNYMMSQTFWLINACAGRRHC